MCSVELFSSSTQWRKKKVEDKLFLLAYKEFCYLLVHSYSIQTFPKQNALMGEISVKIGVKCNLRFTKQLVKATPGLDEKVHYYYLICLCYC